MRPAVRAEGEALSEDTDGTAGASSSETPKRRPAWEVLLPEEGATEDMAAFLAGFLLPATSWRSPVAWGPARPRSPAR